MDAINYPKVVYRKDEKVYQDLNINGKRMKLFNGKKFNIELYPKDQTLYSFRHIVAIDICQRTGSIEKLKAAMGAL